MKKFLLISFVLMCSLFFNSCYTEQEAYASMANDIAAAFKGKDKGYIIANFPYPVTDMKNLGDGYEVLIVERFRPIGGNGITYFYLSNGICYKISTNEYKIVKLK